jgi:hypothetical protein
MMPGWASPGKPTFQADAEAALAAEQAAKEQESASAPQSAATQDSAADQESAGGPRVCRLSKSLKRPKAPFRRKGQLRRYR